MNLFGQITGIPNHKLTFGLTCKTDRGNVVAGTQPTHVETFRTFVGFAFLHHGIGAGVKNLHGFVLARDRNAVTGVGPLHVLKVVGAVDGAFLFAGINVPQFNRVVRRTSGQNCGNQEKTNGAMKKKNDKDNKKGGGRTKKKDNRSETTTRATTMKHFQGHGEIERVVSFGSGALLLFFSLLFPPSFVSVP